jgi:hypothetical protein
MGEVGEEAQPADIRPIIAMPQARVLRSAQSVPLQCMLLPLGAQTQGGGSLSQYFHVAKTLLL